MRFFRLVNGDSGALAHRWVSESVVEELSIEEREAPAAGVMGGWWVLAHRDSHRVDVQRRRWILFVGSSREECEAWVGDVLDELAGTPAPVPTRYVR